MAGILNRAAGGAFSMAFRVVKPMTKAGLSFTWSAGKTTGKAAYRLAPDVLRMGMSYGSSAFETIAARPGMVMGLGATAAIANLASEGMGYKTTGQLSTQNQTAMARYYDMPSTGFQSGMGATLSARQPRERIRYHNMPLTGFEWQTDGIRQSFQQSTEGLTLGLHRARHR